MSALTGPQQEAIEARGNVLVSAGAGTGKTGTVVARCLRLLIEERCPVERILMVTFTEAAAGEMRARLRKELERARDAAARDGEEQGGGRSAEIWASASREEIEEQLALLDTAHISTLHGFGLRLVREHFHELEIDPQFSVLDETQTQPLIHSTFDALFEDCYEGRSPMAQAALGLIRDYGGGSEEKVRSLILRLHRYAHTLPRPERWLAAQAERMAQPEPDNWRDLFVRAVRDWRAEFFEEVAAHNQCDNVAACVRALEACAAHPTFEDAAEAVCCVAAAFRDDWRRGTVGTCRTPLKKFFERALFLESLVADGSDGQSLLEDWNRVREPMRALLELARMFATAFTRAKRAAGGIDFADIEQLALACLLDADGQPTATARQWQEKFEHVFVDEYQDINAVQDAILTAVSRGGARANRFLVGDVKQSIYRFRLADPTIFRAYEEQWRAGNGGRRIPLADNFRSRERVLEFVNPLFAALLRPEVGGIRYDEDANLRFGAATAREPLSAARDEEARVELHVIHGGDEPAAGLNGEPDADGAAEGVDVDRVELEARLIARRLRELRETGHLVWDAETKRLKPVEWRDMVVLLRSPGPRVEGFAKEFNRAGVPLTAARAGFFSALEVCDLLNLLRLLDNPRQDLPLAAVLRSPLFAFSPDEMAVIRAESGRGGSYFAALGRFHFKGGRAPSGSVEESARARVRCFRETFERWRRLIRHTSVSQCLEAILAETHYEALLLAGERGSERVANVHRLLDLARTYDPYQRQGLFRFLNFIREQEDSGLDQDVAAPAGQGVRLMSIHGSKGLEFPVVAVGCLAAQFNQTDLRQDVLLSPELGLCARIVCPESQRRYPSLPWWFARQAEQREMLGEELRLLYVAATRARDTLILTAFDGSRDGELPWPSGGAGGVGTQDLISARHYWHWLKLWLDGVTHPEDWTSPSAGHNRLLRWRRWAKEELAQAAPGDRAVAASEANGRGALDGAELDALRVRLEQPYPFDEAAVEPAKTNVSALRRRAAARDDEARWLFPSRRPEQAAGLSATDLGSAHHAFLQRLELQRVGSLVELRNQAERFVEEGWLTSEEAGALDYPALLRFWQSPRGRRIAGAPSQVRRELPFTARFSIEELRELGLTQSRADGEFVIVQGVVDLAIVGEESIEVLDFKTDRVTRATQDRKKDEYAPQIQLYAAALRATYGKPVSEASLHFLATGETLTIPVQGI